MDTDMKDIGIRGYKYDKTRQHNIHRPIEICSLKGKMAYCSPLNPNSTRQSGSHPGRLSAAR